ncbi:molybdopterin oxidoreductase family protein [Saccharothrix sp. BKS2]|uniref:molybdopterin oxidoreductase family protein n=1 Tax=Saccharothrix sp. BKS2 TaxID=3064400 RepID=UPI0039E963F8
METDWGTAMGRVVEVSKRLPADKGPLTHGFHTTGQMFIEEYYALGVIGKAGLGTPHMDGNTRLCTATSAAAFKESLGADGQPGSCTDIEHCDAIFLYGHNTAETRTVLWMRVLDRTRPADPPTIVCVDPRRTPVALEAERTGGVHLAPRVGTNLALMNGLTRELFVNGWVDERWVDAHTPGVEDLRATVEPCTPQEVARTCGVDADDLRRAARIRRILDGDRCFVVVQDLFLTETARLADVVLPAAAGWGEKTGTFTNVNRTVHLSEKAVDPPGEARSDLDIFLMYAAAVDFRDGDGAPLITWRTPEEVFDAWREATRSRPVDYTGLSYARLRGPTGIPWPVNDQAPDGTDRLCTDAVFPTATDECETYGHDLLTGAAVTGQEHRALRPGGRAFLKGAHHTPAHEEPSEDYPLLCTTGRTAYRFHTRTKTGRSRSPRDAAPDAWVELSVADVTDLGTGEGDVVRVESPRGAIQVKARVGQVVAGAVFAPFHYGSWDLEDADPHRHSGQANELTMTVWDPVSKQPCSKTAACRVVKVRDGDGPAPAPTTAASAPAGDGVPPTAGGAPTTTRRVDTPHYPNDPAAGTSGSAPADAAAGGR